MYCDLHAHSTFSDGTYTPIELVDEAIKAGLSAVALTDHNTADGLPAFLAAVEGKDIDAVPGAEFSVDYEGTELHMLGLFIKPDFFPHVSELMRSVNERKEESNIALIDALCSAGYALDYDEIKSATPNGKFNRAHIAAVMVRKGYVRSFQEAFDGCLSADAGFYKEPKRLSVWEIIDFITSVHAVPVLAHPFLNLSKKQLIEFLPEAKRAGLIGMECYYSLYNQMTTDISLSLAEENGLLPSGGSDFHGSIKPNISLGVGIGNLRIPYAWYEALKEKAQG